VSDPAQNAAELSGGNQQKTVMARALASNPDVLVLGAPTAGVDIAAKQALFGIIRDLNSAILVVSDEIDELAICDRVFVMCGGKITREFQGPWQEGEMVAAMEGLGR
jgi:simple sugar transport system ATP-binding protein